MSAYQCWLCSSVHPFALPSGKDSTPFHLCALPFVILMLIKYRHQCAWPKKKKRKKRSCASRKQNLLFVFLYLSRSLGVAFIQPSNQHSDHQLYRSSIWLSPVLGAWKQRLTQWLSWWQRVSQGCGNTVMIKLLWMVQQSTQRHSGPVKEQRSALLCMQNRL